jgi:hypothetical protein
MRVGRKITSKEMRNLIFRMVAENPTWDAPRIHGELRMLSFDVSERTISAHNWRATEEAVRRWKHERLRGIMAESYPAVRPGSEL